MVEYEKEVKKLYKEVAVLKHAVYKRVQLKKSGPSVSAVQKNRKLLKPATKLLKPGDEITETWR